MGTSFKNTRKENVMNNIKTLDRFAPYTTTYNSYGIMLGFFN